jgi:hypothetical protein
MKKVNRFRIFFWPKRKSLPCMAFTDYDSSENVLLILGGKTYPKVHLQLDPETVAPRE